MIQIAEKRKEMKISQKELATQIGVANSTMNQWETGTRRPSIDMLIKLAEFFGCTTDELLGIDRTQKTESAS